MKPKGLLIFTIWAHPSKTRKYHEPHFPEYEKLIRTMKIISTVIAICYIMGQIHMGGFNSDNIYEG